MESQRTPTNNTSRTSHYDDIVKENYLIKQKLLLSHKKILKKLQKKKDGKHIKLIYIMIVQHSSHGQGQCVWACEKSRHRMTRKRGESRAAINEKIIVTFIVAHPARKSECGSTYCQLPPTFHLFEILPPMHVRFGRWRERTLALHTHTHYILMHFKFLMIKPGMQEYIKFIFTNHTCTSLFLFINLSLYTHKSYMHTLNV